MTTFFNKRGFTLFFAMLVASLALAVGLSIYDLTVRELDLSATATQSQYAIYAADTGAECALYWDVKNSVFATSSGSTIYNGNAFCNSQNITTGEPNNPPVPWSITSAGNAATTTFYLTFSPQPYCATVTVAKIGNPPVTTIVSDGFNTCQGGVLRLERALQVNY